MHVCDDNKRYIVDTFSNGIHDNLQNGKMRNALKCAFFCNFMAMECECTWASIYESFLLRWLYILQEEDEAAYVMMQPKIYS
jgi:hypothetical protein